MEYYDYVYGVATESQKRKYSGLDTYVFDEEVSSDEINDWLANS